MKRRAILFCVMLVALGGAVSCGVWMNRPAAPMAQRSDQVQASLEALPENLFDSALLAYGTKPVVCLDSALYEVQTMAYRRVEPTMALAAPWKAAAAPDGDIWTILTAEQGELHLVKFTLQGGMSVCRELGDSVRDLACDSAGRVYLLTGLTTVQRYSPEGELQGSWELGDEFEAAALAVGKNGAFVCDYPYEGGWPRKVTYVELFEDFLTGDPWEGCVKMESPDKVYTIGSFLPEYILMEYDDVGLYACREDGSWETVCVWSELHLDGKLRGQMIRDAWNRGAVLYEQGGAAYVLILSEKE